MSKHSTESNLTDDAKGALNDGIEVGLKRGFEQARRLDQAGNAEKTARILGVFEVDAGTAAIFDGLWNEVSSRFMRMLQPRSYEVAQKLGNYAGLKGATLDRSVAAAVVATTALATGSQYIVRAVRSHKEHYEKRIDILRKVGPVLDELKGNHSMLSFMTVKEDPAQGGNEVLYAHRRRMGRIADVENSNNYLRIGLNVTPGLFTSFPSISKMWAGNYDPTAAIAASQVPQVGDDSVTGILKDSASLLARGGAGPITERVIRKNEQRLKETLSANSALEMIFTLQEQIEYDPKARSYQLPKESGNRSVGIEEYLLRICVQHQKDMAGINPNHSEIRDLLKEDLIAAIKPVAEAVRAGKLDGYALIRLVGEHGIIKNQGRAIADVEEVRARVEELGNPHGKRRNETPKQFYAERAFTRDELKKALQLTSGDDRHRLIAMVGDAALEDAGLSKKEIKEARAAEMKHYDEHLAHAVVGLASDSDAELKHGGLSQTQIRKLRSMASQISAEGAEVIHSAHGSEDVEKTVLDAAVKRIAAGDASLLGTLSERGAAKLSTHVAEGVSGGFAQRHGSISANDTNDAHKSVSDGFSTRYGESAANESHAARAKRGRQSDERAAVNY